MPIDEFVTRPAHRVLDGDPFRAAQRSAIYLNLQPPLAKVGTDLPETLPAWPTIIDPAEASRPLLSAPLEAARSSSGGHGNHTLAVSPEHLAEAEVVIEKDALEVALLGGLAVSASLVLWSGRLGALMTSLLMSSPAWRGFDLLPVLRQRKRVSDDRRWGEGDEGDGDEGDGTIDRHLGPEVRPTGKSGERSKRNVRARKAMEVTP